MRLAFWRTGSRPPLGPPRTELEKWLGWTRIGALIAAVLVFVVSVGTLVAETSAPNGGGDINIRVEFYTAFERGGGFITWDFSPTASQVLRGRLDTNRDGNVSDSELYDYSIRIKETLTRDVLVVRNFEVVGARMDTQAGLSGEEVASLARAHVHFTFSGQWAQRDADAVLGGDELAVIGFAGPLALEVVRERTIIVNAGLATLQGTSGNSHSIRLPGASIVAASGDWTNGSTPAGLPASRFALFNALDSSVLLLVPMGVGLFLGLGGARRESEATGQRRVERFHRALLSLFLLLIAAYIAAAPGVLIWAGGLSLGAGALALAYRVYPADRRPDDLRPPAPKQEEGRPEVADEPEDWPKILVSAPPLERAAAPMVDAAPAALLPQAPIAPEPAPLPPDRAPRVPRPTPAPPLAPEAAAAAGAPAAELSKRIRCPGCKTMFEVAGTRPLNVTCPHCGRRGVLR